MEQKTQNRPPEDSPQGEAGAPTEESIAAAIALILAGQVVVASVVGAIAALLKLIPGLPDVGDSDVSTPIARMVSRIGRDAPRASGGEITANASNLSYRAHYAIEATKRIAQDVKNGGSVRDALKGEGRYFTAHLEASEAREAGAQLNNAAARRWGPVLSWRHPETGGRDHRPSHVAADGANFDVRNPPQFTDGMLPGQALHCHCVPGAPIPGARMLR
jgi:hypothetical protein